MREVKRPDATKTCLSRVKGGVEETSPLFSFNKVLTSRNITDEGSGIPDPQVNEQNRQIMRMIKTFRKNKKINGR